LLTGWVDQYEVLTREVVCALLEWQRTVPNLKLAEKLLKRLAAQGEFNQIVHQNVTYAVTLSISLRTKKERKQLAHRFMAARRASTFARCAHVEQRICGRALQAKGGDVIPDDLYKWSINDQGIAAYALFWEDETGQDHFSKIPAKCRQYVAQYELLKDRYGIEFFHVVWNCRLASWVPKIAAAVQSMKERQEIFRINHEAAVNPFEPHSILDTIYLSPADGAHHGLLEG
jgi:hypothetical protein